jgi:hypothetical protein
MGTIALDNGEVVYIHDGTGSADPVAISAAEGSSLAALMRNRERFEYSWATSSARTSQTGMVQGSRGYQIDTKTEYIYDGGAWRVEPAYIEFTAANQAVSAGSTQLTGFTVNAGKTTDTTLVSWSLTNFVIARAGVYLLNFSANLSAVTQPAYFYFDSAGGGATSLGATPIVGFVGSASDLFRSTGASQSMYIWITNAAACTVSNQSVRIARLG